MRLDLPPDGRIPRLLAFYRDRVDVDLGLVGGWEPVAYGLELADGRAITVPVEPPASVTLWHSVAEASEELGAAVDTVDPRRRDPEPEAAR